MIGDDNDLIFPGFDNLGRDVDARARQIEPRNACLADFDSGAQETVVFELDGKVKLPVLFDFLDEPVDVGQVDGAGCGVVYPPGIGKVEHGGLPEVFVFYAPGKKAGKHVLVFFEGDAGQVHFWIIDQVQKEVAQDGLGDGGDIVLLNAFTQEPVVESAVLSDVIKVGFAGAAFYLGEEQVGIIAEGSVAGPFLCVGAGDGRVLQGVGIYGCFACGEWGPSGFEKVGVLGDDILSVGILGLFGMALGKPLVKAEPLHFAVGGVTIGIEDEPLFSGVAVVVE